MKQLIEKIIILLGYDLSKNCNYYKYSLQKHDKNGSLIRW